MRLFSQRKGIKPIKSKIQSYSMDDDLKNGLWNALTFYYWKSKVEVLYDHLPFHRELHILCYSLWHSFFKAPLDTLNDDWTTTYGKIRKYFFESKWNEIYDFIEFVSNNYPDESVNQRFMEACNGILEKEMSAYRFIGGKITQITSEEEISTIEEAIKLPIDPVREHINRSLELLSDRKNPDYRNSIKEAISAVESLCNLIADKKADLGQALKEVEKNIAFHPALKKAFGHLYGYTSDADGIRHSLLEQPNLNFEDAKFMLVSCSAFINYLLAKASKAGIKL